MSIAEIEIVQRASVMRFKNDDNRTGQMLYSLGQLLGERAKVAEMMLSGHLSRESHALLKDQYERYDQMLKHYLAIS